jgi:hypothetical protein
MHCALSLAALRIEEFKPGDVLVIAAVVSGERGVERERGGCDPGVLCADLVPMRAGVGADAAPYLAEALIGMNNFKSCNELVEQIAPPRTPAANERPGPQLGR